MARNPKTYCSRGQLTALRIPHGPQRVNIPEADPPSSLLECGEVNNNSPPPGIQLLGATKFHHLWASDEGVDRFTTWLGECQSLLRASLEGLMAHERMPTIPNEGAGAVVVVTAEQWYGEGAWMTTAGSPRHEERYWSTGIVCCEELSDPAVLEPWSISTQPWHATMQMWLMWIETYKV